VYANGVTDRNNMVHRTMPQLKYDYRCTPQQTKASLTLPALLEQRARSAHFHSANWQGTLSRSQPYYCCRHNSSAGAQAHMDASLMHTLPGQRSCPRPASSNDTVQLPYKSLLLSYMHMQQSSSRMHPNNNQAEPFQHAMLTHQVWLYEPRICWMYQPRRYAESQHKQYAVSVLVCAATYTTLASSNILRPQASAHRCRS
jgi:hypothetical protein